MSVDEGRKAFANGDYTPALAMLEDFFERSEVGLEARESGLRNDMRKAFLELAQLHQRLDDDPLRSIELCEELAENDAKVFGKDSTEYALTLLEVADAYQELDHPDLVRASELIDTAERRLLDTPHFGLVLYARGSLAFDKDDYKGALEVLDRSLAFLPEDDNERRALVLNVKSLRFFVFALKVGF
jgi:tetratricopeptide (TPR) repeat protein